MLKKVFVSNSSMAYKLLQANLIDEGHITNSEVQGVLSFTTPLEKLPQQVIIWLYSAVWEAFDLPQPSVHFTKSEIDAANMFMIERHQSHFPLKFKILDKLAHGHQYLISQSAQEINALKKGGIIVWDKHIQRESIVSKFKDHIVAHINYNDKRAREIGKKMAANEYYANSLRWHLIQSNDVDYTVAENEIVIKSGTIAEIDGQHRDKGSEYGLIENPSMFLRFPILFTIGTVSEGQAIIHQEEKRSPINKRHVSTYAPSSANNIVKEIIASNDLDDVYRFSDTVQAYHAGAGIILKDSFISAIRRHYNVSSVSRNEEKRIAKWIVLFLNSLAEEFFDDFSNYRKVFGAKWNVAHYAFYGYVYLSSVLRDDENWEQGLKEILSKIDFVNKPWRLSSVPDKYVEKEFEGCYYEWRKKI